MKRFPLQQEIGGITFHSKPFCERHPKIFGISLAIVILVVVGFSAGPVARWIFLK